MAGSKALEQGMGTRRSKYPDRAAIASKVRAPLVSLCWQAKRTSWPSRAFRLSEATVHLETPVISRLSRTNIGVKS
jgi:hypothetical protein